MCLPRQHHRPPAPTRRQVFRRAQRQEVRLDVHSYTNMLNAHVRCGDLDGGRALLAMMRGAGVVPNVVTHTTLIKGMCEAGQVRDAIAHAATMAAAGANPNVRTCNTVLRGCVRVGAIDEG